MKIYQIEDSTKDFQTIKNPKTVCLRVEWSSIQLVLLLSSKQAVFQSDTWRILLRIHNHITLTINCYHISLYGLKAQPSHNTYYHVLSNSSPFFAPAYQLL